MAWSSTEERRGAALTNPKGTTAHPEVGAGARESDAPLAMSGKATVGATEAEIELTAIEGHDESYASTFVSRGAHPQLRSFK